MVIDGHSSTQYIVMDKSIDRQRCPSAVNNVHWYALSGNVLPGTFVFYCPGCKEFQASFIPWFYLLLPRYTSSLLPTMCIDRQRCPSIEHSSIRPPPHGVVGMLLFLHKCIYMITNNTFIPIGMFQKKMSKLKKQQAVRSRHIKSCTHYCYVLPTGTMYRIPGIYVSYIGYPELTAPRDKPKQAHLTRERSCP